jgi:enhancing lycopene biosynthesis protein 2
MQSLQSFLLTVSGFIIFSVINSVQPQYFDPTMDDQVYLNITHDKVREEVTEAKKVLIEQAEIVRTATRAFIGAKLKENLFRVKSIN